MPLLVTLRFVKSENAFPIAQFIQYSVGNFYNLLKTIINTWTPYYNTYEYYDETYKKL